MPLRLLLVSVLLQQATMVWVWLRLQAPPASLSVMLGPTDHHAMVVHVFSLGAGAMGPSLPPPPYLPPAIKQQQTLSSEGIAARNVQLALPSHHPVRGER